MERFKCDICEGASEGAKYRVSVGVAEVIKEQQTQIVSGMLVVCEECYEGHVTELVGAVSRIQSKIPPVEQDKP